MADFTELITASYSFTVPSVQIGRALRDEAVLQQPPIAIPLPMMNRHGLIAGSTGTGKTRTLQRMAEELSRHGVPTFLADVKGDLSGMFKAGVTSPKLEERSTSMGEKFAPEAYPVEFFSLTGALGTQIRATVSSFGPVLLGKVLDLTEVQQSVLAMVFKYCDDRKMPLLDFSDLRGVLQYLSDEGKEELKEYGAMSGATVGVLVRKMVELEQQGAEQFFGEPELDIKDLMRLDANGKGVINILSLSDIQDKPRLYSTFLMWLLGQFYYDMPEAGDLDKPKLVFFFDEAHLLFEDASSALTEHIEQVARLIRSKGIGVFFITQTAKDVSNEVLAQLGNRVQHAIRAFTPKDAKDLRATASTFPKTEFIDIEETLTTLGIGDALVTVLSPKGVPTPVCIARIAAPRSYMGQLAPEEYQTAFRTSSLRPKYETAIDRESAKEILQRKLDAAAQAQAAEEPEDRYIAPTGGVPPRTYPSRSGRRSTRQPKGMLETVLTSSTAKTAARQVARTVTQQVVRGIFGMFKR
jgi:DNA helicase HerA-like ATPase